MKFCFIVRIKDEDGDIGVYSTICDELELIEQLESVVSYGYCVVEVFRLCSFDRDNRPLILVTANIPMLYDDFCNEVLKDE